MHKAPLLCQQFNKTKSRHAPSMIRYTIYLGCGCCSMCYLEMPSSATSSFLFLRIFFFSQTKSAADERLGSSSMALRWYETYSGVRVKAAERAKDEYILNYTHTHTGAVVKVPSALLIIFIDFVLPPLCPLIYLWLQR